MCACRSCDGSGTHCSDPESQHQRDRAFYPATLGATPKFPIISPLTCLTPQLIKVLVIFKELSLKMERDPYFNPVPPWPGRDCAPPAGWRAVAYKTTLA